MNNKAGHPKAGQRWHLKGNSNKIAKIDAVHYGGSAGDGYVEIEASWLTRNPSGKAMDTFLKQYQKSEV